MKYPLVLQQNEEDCGAACIASIVKYYGHSANNLVREVVGSGMKKSTLLGLRQAAEALGFNAKAFTASPEQLFQLRQVALPAIIHWKGCQWVVLYGKRGEKYIVGDPAIGLCYVSAKELTEAWQDGVILLLEPDPVRFLTQPSDRIGAWRRFIARVSPYKTILSQALLYAWVVGLLSLAYPFLIQILTDEVLVRGDMNLLTIVAIAVIAIQAVSSGLKLVEYNLIAHFAQRLELGLILDFARVILRLPLSYYEARRSGEIVSRLQDIQQINYLVSQAVTSLPSQFTIALVSLGFMLFYSSKLTAIAFIFAALMATSTIALLPSLRRKIHDVLVLDTENQGLLVEIFKGALTMKTTTAAPQFWEEFQSRFGRLAQITFRTIQIDIVNYTFAETLSGISTIALLWFGSNLVIAKELTIGQLLAFNSMNTNFLAFIQMSISFIDEWMRVQIATQRLTEVIEFPPETQHDYKKPFVTITEPADIICTNLSFHYPDNLAFISDLSLKIPGGQVTALIGESACGKSTLVKLIAGLYQIQSGNIRIGAYNLQDISLDCLRQQVVLVPQEPHFWSRSIVDNFRLGSPQVTLQQIVQACQITGADEFISQLPEKYQTVLGEFGANISGGQRQRLAIARAIVNEPPILILDESTAGLDPESEAQVLHQLLYNRLEKTTILISHRPQVINRADWLVVFNDGKLLLQGPLEKVRSQPGEHLEFLKV